MKIDDLSKELGVTNKELITFLKENGYKVSSHMQKATDEMIDISKELNKKPVEEEKIEDVVPELDSKKTIEEPVETKIFKNDDLIPCRSVTPWKLNAVSVDRTKVYHWSYYGDVDYLSYRDLQALRRTDYITKPKILIEDADLCYQWRKELGDTYKYFLNVEYPEEFFDLSDDSFTTLLDKAPSVLKDVIKVTAMAMIKAQNYPTINKLNIIDNMLGTCLKEFI